MKNTTRKLLKRLDWFQQQQKRIAGMGIYFSRCIKPDQHVPPHPQLGPRLAAIKNWCTLSEQQLRKEIHARLEQERREVAVHGQSEPASSPVPEETKRSSSPEEELSNDDRFVIPTKHPWYKRVQHLRQQGRPTNIAIRKSRIHNVGVFAQRFMSKNTIIVEYMGERIDKAEQRRREADGRTAPYCYVQLPNGCVIDGNRNGNIGKLVNHSCEPNTVLEHLTFPNEDFAVVITARKKIRKGEELTFDYRLPADGNEPIPCNCGSKKCRGFLEL